MTGQLKNDPDITLRNNEPTIYDKITDNSHEIAYQDTQNGYEYDVFIPNGNMIARFVFTSSSQSGISDDINTVLNSLNWH